MIIRPYSRQELKDRFDSATPFRFFMIDDFLDADFAQQVSAAYPGFDDARKLGREFSAVNEKRKVQISDASLFPAPVARLNEALAGAQFRADLEFITGIPNLRADAGLQGGGIHVTGPSGRLDVHVDFNFRTDQELHRRLNILVYLNTSWDESWGGAIELWDRDLTRAHHTIAPAFNRCVVFETSEISYHGVTPVECPDGAERRSFAAYYYTKEAPPGWEGRRHSTIFKARPDEKLRRYLLMPAERLQRRFAASFRQAVKLVKEEIGR